ncbi:hypothetical protein BDV25DRAFT_36277 [Aspergillus avenaceus]|uniref:Essential protein Yae1 N-terminal domain-containing protein n=1 Tax=Aspergillus avenaceus TaxID=36643 RepID=A0A5N6TLM4_ASPAV|nr:hypothetical protein BDV25DRAFT_36277 [Aspergillus avenaceus]
MENNLFESLLDLEEEFYREGYDLGAIDGAQAGYTEGSVFAVEKGFEKFIEIGRLYGKALVWAQRLSELDTSKFEGSPDTTQPTSHEENETDPSVCKGMSSFPASSRLAKNIDTLLELVDPASLSMQNTEAAVTDVDERLKGAAIKAKLIQRALGERENNADIHPHSKESQSQTSGDGTGNIEDISALKIRQ